MSRSKKLVAVPIPERKSPLRTVRVRTVHVGRITTAVNMMSVPNTTPGDLDEKCFRTDLQKLISVIRT